MEPVFSLSLWTITSVCPRPLLALLIKVQVRGFLCERGVCACMCTRRGCCHPQHSLAAIRLKSCCCGAGLSFPLQDLQLTLKLLLHTTTALHIQEYSHRKQTANKLVSNAHAHTINMTNTIPPFPKVVCVASELTPHHHPGCWQPLLKPHWELGCPSPSPLCSAWTTTLLKHRQSLLEQG